MSSEHMRNLVLGKQDESELIKKGQQEAMSGLHPEKRKNTIVGAKNRDELYEML